MFEGDDGTFLLSDLEKFVSNPTSSPSSDVALSHPLVVAAWRSQPFRSQDAKSAATETAATVKLMCSRKKQEEDEVKTTWPWPDRSGLWVGEQMQA